MVNKNIIGVIVFATATLLSCSTDIGINKTNKPIVYKNISIYSDLSNRLSQSPNDSLIIEQLITYFKEDCVKPGIKINDRSAISFSKLNSFNSQCSKANIDLNEFGSLSEKQKFVNNTSKNNLDSAIKKFRESVFCNYKNPDTRGLDIISLLAYEIKNGICLKETKTIIGQYDTTYFYYDNHIFLFTDGYLEFRTKDGNRDYYFGSKKIERLRIALNKQGSTNINQFLDENPDFSIPVSINPNNKFINLHVLETYDRGLNKEYGTIKNSGPLSDNNILKAVWKHWAVKSGFNSFTWRMMTNQNTLPNDYVKKIITAHNNG